MVVAWWIVLCDTSGEKRCMRFYKPTRLPDRRVELLYLGSHCVSLTQALGCQFEQSLRHDYVGRLLTLVLQARYSRLYAHRLNGPVLHPPIQQSSCSVPHALHANAGAVTPGWGFVNEVQAHKTVMLVLHIHAFLSPLHIGENSFSTVSCHCTP